MRIWRSCEEFNAFSEYTVLALRSEWHDRDVHHHLARRRHKPKDDRRGDRGRHRERGNEKCRLTLSIPTGGATLGSKATDTVTSVDHELPPPPLPPPPCGRQPFGVGTDAGRVSIV